ncbi:MAG TPA: hypothetical protein PK867_18980 [Pirellulales bacterium]|nr:hypothetical protein [Pirellulales bacterium]
MRRRPRPFQRFVPRLEALENRSLLSSLPVAPPLPPGQEARTLPPGQTITGTLQDIQSEAVGTVNGQLEVLGVIHRDLAARNILLVDIYNYNPPPSGSTSPGGFTATQTLTTDIPAGPDVKIAFGNLKSGLPDLVVAGPDFQGSLVVEVFTGGVDPTGNWQFNPLNESGADDKNLTGMTAGGGTHGYGLALGDVDNNGVPDVVLTSGKQVEVVLGSAVQDSSGTVVGYNYTALAPVNDPFLNFVGQGAGPNSLDFAPFSMIQNDGGGYDLITEADNHFLFTPMVISTSTSTTTPPVTTSTVTFPDPVDAVAILPSGTSTAGPLTAPLKGGARPADAIFATGIICIVSPCPGDPQIPDLVAVIGGKVYVGIGSDSTTSASGAVTYGPLTFTWHVDTFADSFTSPGTVQGLPGGGGTTFRPDVSTGDLFLADLNNDGQADLFSVAPDPRGYRISSLVFDVLPETRSG